MVHRVRILEDQYSIQISTFYPTMSIGQWSQRHASIPQQPDHFALWLLKIDINRECAICTLCRVCNDHYTSMKWPMTSTTLKLKFQKELTVDVERHVGTLSGYLRKRSRTKSKWDPVHEKKYQLKKYEDTTNCLLKHNIWSTDPGLTARFFNPIDLSKVKSKNYVIRLWVLIIKTDKHCNFLKTKVRWISKDFQDKQKEYKQTDSPASTRPGFRMSCSKTATKVGTLFTLILRQLSFKDRVLGRESWCCVSIVYRSRTSSIYCCKIEETGILHEWCVSTLMEHFWQDTVQLWHDSHKNWSILLRFVFNTVAWANLKSK